jgi:hypothetical protein
VNEHFKLLFSVEPLELELELETNTKTQVVSCMYVLQVFLGRDERLTAIPVFPVQVGHRTRVLVLRMRLLLLQGDVPDRGYLSMLLL